MKLTFKRMILIMCICQMRNAGHSITDIAKAVKLSESTVRRLLKSAGATK